MLSCSHSSFFRLLSTCAAPVNVCRRRMDHLACSEGDLRPAVVVCGVVRPTCIPPLLIAATAGNFDVAQWRYVGCPE